jgi:glycosyltransferase involved in cell wall biosynthesis
MKILLLSHAPNNRDSGASRIYHTLEEGLTARGHAVKTYHYEDYSLPRSRHARRVIERLLLPQFIASRSRQEASRDYDIVMASAMGYPLFRRLAGQYPRRPVTVNHLHGLSLFDHQANLTEHLAGRLKLSLAYRTVTGPMVIAWEARASSYADLTIVQNDRDYDYLLRSPLRSKRIVCIPPGIYSGVMAHVAAAPRPEERPAASMLWFGSWIARKGIHALPAAFDLILDQVPHATLTIGGVHLPERVIREQFSARAAARVRVLQRISIAEQATEFGRHAIFLFPSLSEGFGLALVEAMALGLAGVATHTGVGGDSLVHGDTAMIVPEASAVHLARAVVTLMTNDGLRNAMARRGQSQALTFTTDRMISRYEAAFLAALERRDATSSA